MDTGINNGKQRTNNISRMKCLLFLFILFHVAKMDAMPDVEKTWVIVIDAGHGGKDPGALGATSREKNITLAIALKTGEYIEQHIKNAKVLYTRKTDVKVDIRDRAEFANRNKADLFISIHANWAGSKSIKGTETFIMGHSKDEQNLEVAMKENEVILLEDDFTTKYEGFDPKSPESYIMFTLMQNIFQEQSTSLASNIQNQFKTRVSRIDRGVKQAGFWVLYMTTMPSVLIETGFITNAEEERYLSSKEGQDYIASAIFRAARDYIYDIDKKSGISTAGQQSSDSINEQVEAKTGSSGDLSFMVQIATSAEKLIINADNFKGLPGIIEISAQDRYKYATGKFENYQDAVTHRKSVESIFPDAFVIAVRNNKILPLQEALELTQNK